jgi:hypothetical protein
MDKVSGAGIRYELGGEVAAQELLNVVAGEPIFVCTCLLCDWSVIVLF